VDSPRVRTDIPSNAFIWDLRVKMFPACLCNVDDAGVVDAPGTYACSADIGESDQILSARLDVGSR